MNAWLVARHEYKRHVLKRSFPLALLSVSLLVAVMIGANALTSPLRAAPPSASGRVDAAGLPRARQGERTLVGHIAGPNSQAIKHPFKNGKKVLNLIT